MHVDDKLMKIDANWWRLIHIYENDEQWWTIIQNDEDWWQIYEDWWATLKPRYNLYVITSRLTR